MLQNAVLLQSEVAKYHILDFDYKIKGFSTAPRSSSCLWGLCSARDEHIFTQPLPHSNLHVTMKQQDAGIQSNHK